MYIFTQPLHHVEYATQDFMWSKIQVVFCSAFISFSMTGCRTKNPVCITVYNLERKKMSFPKAKITIET